MNTTITVGIIGATGLVGSEIGQCLSESNISQDVEFKLFASADSEGEVYNIRGQEVVVGVLGEDAYKGLNVAIFALKQDLAKKEIKKALKNGAYVIDTSTAYQADGDGKLVHSTLNPECITADTKHYVIPSPAACQIAVVTKKLLSLNKIKNI